MAEIGESVGQTPIVARAARFAPYARRLGRALADVLMPRDCLLCAGPSGGRNICTDCRDALPTTPEACPVCALPSPHGAVCGACLVHRPAFDRTVALYRYAFPADRLVQSLKYGSRLPAARWFAEALAARVGVPPRVDLIVPVPLAAARLRERGFNQSVEIARRLAPLVGVPISLDAIARVRSTVTQTALPVGDRARNVRGAFAASVAVLGARIAVVDDVMTTGATLAEIARVAKRAGAVSVENWVVARAYTPRT